jgi:hypothetical protein
MEVILGIDEYTVMYITEIPKDSSEYYQKCIEPMAYSYYIPAEARIYFVPAIVNSSKKYELLPGLGIKTIDRSAHDRLLEARKIAGILRESGL